MNSKGNAFSRGYSEIYSHNLNVSHEMFAAVLNIRTKEQDKRLRQQINKYRTDIDNIIKQQKDNQELLNPLN
jgi:cell division protein ZapA (FtsZ GTPase activity inhibitor)